MMKASLKWLVLAGLVTSGSAALAHHSFSATYDESKEEVIEGTIVQFLLRNPHSMLHVEVKGEDGESHRYAIEWAGVAGLNEEGITRTTLRIGDKVSVRGNPGRNKTDYRLRLLSIDRPLDGWHWGGSFL
jgi:hypothetical protein